MHSKLNHLFIALLVAAFGISGCATQSSGGADYDVTHDFSVYSTFAWISDHPMKVGPVLEDPRDSLEPSIMDAIRATLEAKGYRIVERDAEPDFLVSFTVGSREKVRPAGYPTMQPQPGGRWSWGTEYHGGSEGAKYTQGVLAIDIFDATEKRPVWHAVTGKRIDETDRDNMDSLIGDVVRSLLSDFPP